MIYLLVLLSVTAMTAAQLLLKKGLILLGNVPESIGELVVFFEKACTNIYVIAAAIMTLVTALAWIIAVSKAELSFIYPFMALSYVLVAVFSLLIFKEDINTLRWVGIVVICVGVFFVSRS